MTSTEDYNELKGNFDRKVDNEPMSKEERSALWDQFVIDYHNRCVERKEKEEAEEVFKKLKDVDIRTAGKIIFESNREPKLWVSFVKDTFSTSKEWEHQQKKLSGK